MVTISSGGVDNLSLIYLIRHGQAGTRDNYDSLSDLGREQARLAGERLRERELTAVYSGSLARQRATAAEALPGVNVQVDPGWDEFDLAQVYEEFAPHLIRDDEQFRIEHEEMQRAIAAGDAEIHRKWNDCDRKVVRAWVKGLYEYSGESWPAFVERVHGALERVTREGDAAVFTSATPIGIAAAKTMKIQDGRAMWLAGALFNASITTLHTHKDTLRLFTMNNTPHFNELRLWTFR